ncbi:apolipoprotein N-acyltransferase [Stappia aggregata IAM 12614]|uniref:Apolipoprotein N-acyltransferase n=1 Tax=Roseibium aggregatum (strain ATCC 25650 / DSM 13394 / JCM 20685 / NBRC 16684 / NCIMB 2208 / IAM 12614 / B1) TaxID=384765 RepID=A0NUJ3_ROSAI|nr:apolipoprotein N-acyltransferase [Stappia aggregata IAM 12614] [Roseibium aggregatum IAM 12614]
MCAVCGAITAFALPPYDFSLVLLLTFPCFVWLLDGAVDPAPGTRFQRFRTGFALGWLFGFGYFLSGLWWIGAAFLVEAERFAWLMPFAVLAMPVGLALFTGLGVGLAAIFWSDQFRRILLLAAGLTLTDWLRGHVLTGFPWNAFGYGVSGSLSLSQAASLVGLYGLTFFVVAVFSAPAVLADARPLRQRVTAVAAAAVALVAVAGHGAVRLWQADLAVAGLDIRIVQPSIDQKDKWRPELRDEIFQTFLDMTQAPLGGAARVGQPRMVVWPESAVPFLLTQEPGALFRIGQSLAENTELVTGAIRAEPGLQGADYFNSVFVIGSEGTVQGIYDKVRLVPFGEYVPFKPLLELLGISNLAGPLEGFEAGYQPRVLTTSESFGFLPMICYEAIFPGSLDGVSKRPDFLLNVTNDAWFGRTPGPYQHLAQARLRAIESGLPLIRAANTGISAVIDPKGRVVAKLAIFERGLIDARLPQRLGNTLYGSIGDGPALVFSFFIVVFAGVYQYNRNSRIN